MKEEYAALVLAADGQVKKLQVRVNQFSLLRLGVTALGLVFFYQSLGPDSAFWPVFVTFLTILTFAFVVRAQNGVEKLLHYHKNLKVVYENEIRCMAGDGNMYDDGAARTDDLHSYTSDLDIFGKHSIYALLNRSASHGGNRVLADWLVDPATADELEARQVAIKEIALKKDWRFHFQSILLFANGKPDYSAQFLSYLKLASVPGNHWIRFYVRWNPYAFSLAILSSFWFPPASLLVLVLGIVNLGIAQFYSTLVLKADSMLGKMQALLKPFSEAMDAVTSENWQSTRCQFSDVTASIASEKALLKPFSEAMDAVTSENWQSTRCQSLCAEFQGDDQDSLPLRLKELRLMINRLNLGLSSIGPVLNFVTTWNMRQFLAIEDWKQKSRVNLERAFDALAHFEALNSLASLSVNNPGWVFPEIVRDEKFSLDAGDIGHPLIPASERVSNNYSISDTRHIDLITGSNMAGKSTFLRTLGVNTVLALAGAPVCASHMRLSIMKIFSYMRIKDSVSGGTSTFKAELDRLKQLLNILTADQTVFFLIDEMLRGTNSGDKYRGSKGVIKKLVSMQTSGIVATHDLKLAEMENEYPGYIRNYHFDIDIEGEEMLFSYKLKNGPCETFNAAVLLRKLGIEE